MSWEAEVGRGRRRRRRAQEAALGTEARAAEVCAGRGAWVRRSFEEAGLWRQWWPWLRVR